MGIFLGCKDMKDIEEEGNRIGSVSQFVKANNARMSLCMVRPG